MDAYCISRHLEVTASDFSYNVFEVQASIASNVFAISGNCEDKALSDLVPGILTQLGQDSLASLRKLAESFEAQKNANGETVGDDDVPDLVENFEEEAKK